MSSIPFDFVKLTKFLNFSIINCGINFDSMSLSSNMLVVVFKVLFTNWAVRVVLFGPRKKLLLSDDLQFDYFSNMRLLSLFGSEPAHDASCWPSFSFLYPKQRREWRICYLGWIMEWFFKGDEDLSETWDKS